MNQRIFNISDFKILKQINSELVLDLKNIQNECKILINNINKITIKRKEGDWSNENAIQFVENLKKENKWMHGWTQKDNWKNYLLIFNGYMMDDIQEKLPCLYKILNKYKDKFNVVGLSLLEPNSKIPYHFDADTEYENNRLVYHFNINIPDDYNNQGKSILAIFQKKINDIDNPTIIQQQTGNHIIFDSSYYHMVQHLNPEQRLILYTDIKVSEMR